MCTTMIPLGTQIIIWFKIRWYACKIAHYIQWTTFKGSCQVFGKCQIFSEEPHLLVSSVPQHTVEKGGYKEKNKAEAFSVVGWNRGWWRRVQTLELMARERSFPGRILPLILATFWTELPTDQRIIGRLKPSRETGKMSLFQLPHYVWLFFRVSLFPLPNPHRDPGF